MMAWLEGEIETDTIPIHYYRTGGEKPALILLHGLSDNGLCWTPIAQALQTEYDVVMLDARGHGLSGRYKEAIPLEMLAGDVATSIKALELGKVCLMRHSMGAATAAFMTAKYPDLVEALVLEDPPWSTQKPGEGKATGAPGIRSWTDWIIPLRGLSPEERLIRARKNNPTWLVAELEPWVEAKDQLDLNIFEKGIDIMHPHWSEYVAQIGSPTLLVTGDNERGAIVSQETAQLVEQALPNGHVAHIQGVGHNIRREQHDVYMNVVSTFLRANKARS